MTSTFGTLLPSHGNRWFCRWNSKSIVGISDAIPWHCMVFLMDSGFVRYLNLVTFGRAMTASLCPVRVAWRIQERVEHIQHPLGLLGVSSATRAMYVAIRWRTQKNNVNGQLVTFARATTAYLCPVRAAWRIQERGEHIQHPLGMLGVSSTGPIAKHDANQHLHACATRMYSYMNKTDLEKYTLHSIRVGACVLLYELNKSARPPLSRIAFIGGQIPLWTIYVIHPALQHCMRRVYDGFM